jgi:hypothetical protein
MNNILSTNIFGEGLCYHSSLTEINTVEDIPTFDKISLLEGTKPILFLELLLILYSKEGVGIKYLKKSLMGTEGVVLKMINKEIKQILV